MAKRSPQEAESAAYALNAVLDKTEAGFYMEAATLYSIIGESVLPVATNNDIYAMLESDSNIPLCVNAEFIGVATTGWAAPVDDGSELPPSQHPERRRVRLVVVTDGRVMSSVMSMSGESDEIVSTGEIGGDTPHGNLLDTLVAFADQVHIRRQSSLN